MATNSATQPEVRTDTAPRWTGCDGPDEFGCEIYDCRCECGYWGSGCEHPLTPEEIAQFGSQAAPWVVGSRCACGFGLVGA